MNKKDRDTKVSTLAVHWLIDGPGRQPQSDRKKLRRGAKLFKRGIKMR